MNASLLGIIGGILTIIIMLMKWYGGKDRDKQKEKDDLDKEIDNASSITDFIRIDDKLRQR